MSLKDATSVLKDLTRFLAAGSGLLTAIGALVPRQAAEQIAEKVGFSISAVWLWIIAAGSFAVVISLRGRRGGSSVKDHEAFNIGHKYLEGREQDIGRLAQALQHAPFVWLVGESGSGKSSFLDRGLRVRLDEDASRIAIYLNEWGLDWIQGPLDALADAVRRRLSKEAPAAAEVTAPLTGDEALKLLGDLAERGRLPVLLFDQAEDYLTLHRDHFTSAQAIVPESAIVERNHFWATIAGLLREGKVRCLFACRKDMVGFFESLRFQAPDIRLLAMISTSSAADLIRKIRELGAVSAPENGFDQLTSRLLRELDADGWVLPIQLRVALQGLSRLPSLTVSAYEAEGGLRGLEALYIRTQVAKTARLVGWDAGEVRSLLVAMVDRSQRPLVSSPKSIASLLAEVASRPRSQEDLAVVLRELCDADLVRPSLDPKTGDQVWQLDHDYLSRGVIELDRKARRSYLELEESARTFRTAAGLGRKWASLLSPRQQVALVYDRLRRRFTYGPYRRFAVLSTLRLLVHPWVAALAAAIVAIHFFSLLSLSDWSRGLAGASRISKDLDSALLFAVAAQAASPTADAESALLAGLQTAPQLRTILHGQATEALAFAPHEAILASADEHGAIQFWDTKSWSARGDPVRAGSSRITSLAFSGNVLVSGDVKGLLRFWDALRGAEVRGPVAGGRGPIETVALHPGGRYAVAGGYGGALLWDLEQKPPRAIELPVATTATLGSFNPAGHRLALVGGSGSLVLWDFADGVLSNPWQAPIGAGVTALAWNLSGDLVVGRSNGSILWLGEGARTIRLQREQAHSDQVSCLAFNDDGSLLASGGLDGKIHVWNDSGELVFTLPGKVKVRDVAFEPGTSLLASGAAEPRIHIWDTEMDQPLARPVLRSAQLTNAVAFASHGRSLLAGMEDGRVQWIDLSGQRPPRSLRIDARADILGLDVAGDWLLWNDEKGRVGLWDLATGHGETFAQQATKVTALAMHDPDGFAIGGSDGRVTVWRRRGKIWGSTLFQAQPHSQEPLSSIGALGFDPDGKVLVAGDDTGRLLAWDVGSGHLRHQWKLLQGVTDLAFSPDGRQVAVGTLAQDGVINFIHPSREEAPTPVATPCNSVEFVAFSRDGRSLRVECDGSLELLKLDAGSWRSAGTIQLTTGSIWGFVASPKEDVVAVVTEDSEGLPLVLIWDLDEASWERRACRRANREMPASLAGWTGLPAGRCKSLLQGAAPEAAGLRLDED